MKPELDIDIPELVVLLKRKNITLKLRNKNIELFDTDNNLDQELIKLITNKKTEIIDFLSLYQRKEEYFPIPVAKKKEHYVLSSMQKRLYFLWEMDKTLSNYNMPSIVSLGKPISKEKLASIIKELCNRHEMFRASFHYHNENHYFKIADYAMPDIECIETEEENVFQIIRNFVQPFDLSKAPLFRVQLIKIKNGVQLLLTDMHHIISDGVSNNILKKEFLTLFNGDNLEPIKTQYKDFTEWQDSKVFKELIEKQEKYWLNLYSDEINTLQLPIDFPRPKYRSYSGGIVSFTINKNHTDAIKEITKSNGGTLFITLLSIFNILLYKLTNQEDIVIGTPVAGRNHPDIAQTIGFFVNTLALRNKPTGEMTFIEFCKQVKENTFKSLDNQDYEFGELVDKLNVQRETSRNPIFDVMLSLLNHREFDEFQKSKNNSYQFNNTAKFDLTLFCSENGSEVLCSFNYYADIFKETTIKRFAEYFLKVIDTIVTNNKTKISEISLITEKEKQKILYDFNDTQSEYPKDKTIIELFEEQVKLTPEATAVVFEERKISYRELNNHANQLGRFLKDKGVTRNSIVAIIVERSIEMIIGIYGILKAGGAYLPIDPNYPESRKKFMIENSNAVLVLTQNQFLNTFKSELEIINLNSENLYQGQVTNLNLNSPDDLAYVIYTSGSTGNPKGVMIKHDSLNNRLNWMQKMYPLGSDDTILHKTPFTFDVSVWELFWWSLTGSKVCLLKQGEEKEPEAIVNTIEEKKITILHFVPPMLGVFLDHIEFEGNVLNKLISLKQVITSGEALLPIQVERFNNLLKRSNGSNLANLYGPTEATVDVTYFNCPHEGIINEVPIGKPIDNTTIYILDKYLNIQPIGVSGELWIGGVGLALGYLNNEKLTKEKFINSPFGEGKLYHTGDLARWLPDGNIEFLGRIDHQVKIRGNRIELGEIETTLAKQEKIKEAVVLAFGQDSDKYLCAYVVSYEEIETRELRSYLSQSLPDYMLPSHFVRVENIPLTSNGKIDRKTLPKPEVKAGEGYMASSNDIENKLVEIWSEVLKIDMEQISVNRSFFELGGHSLKATLLVNKIVKEFKVEISLREIFNNQDIISLSKIIQNSEKKSSVVIKKTLLKDHYKISSAQKRLLFLYEFDRTSLAYNMPQVVKLDGSIDKERLSIAFNKLIARHESLHTSFEIVDGEPVQKITPQANLEIEYFEIDKNGAQQIIKEFIRPFDLNKSPLIRVGLIDILEQEHVLMVDMHHIITDGTSQGILIKDFMALYNEEELPKLELQYKDYSEWQQSAEQQENISKQKTFWLNEFAEEVVRLDLPTDLERGTLTSKEGSKIRFNINEEETSNLKLIVETEGTTLFMVLLSIYYILLSKLSNQEDIVIGTPTAGRQHNDLEKIIGMFINTLPMRNYPKGELNFIEFLSEVKNKTLACLDNQTYQYEELIDELKVVRDTSRNPLFDVMFVFQNFEREGLEMQGLKLTPYSSGHKVSKFEMTLAAAESQGQIVLSLEYLTQLYSKATIERFIAYFKEIVSDVISNHRIKLSEIDILTKKEKQQLLYEFNDVKVKYPKDKTIIELFEEQVKQRPQNISVTFNDEIFNYYDLNRKANQLGRKLRLKGVKPDDIIALVLDRSIDMIIGILAILKAGGAYLPIDPNYPEGRQKHMLEDSKSSLILTQKSLIENIPSQIEKIDIKDEEIYTSEEENLIKVNKPNDLAYIIYTSGSTGTPKGVMLEHENIVRLMILDKPLFDFTHNDVWTMFHSYCFDFSVWEMYGALLFGGKLVIIPSETARDTKKFLEILVNEKVSVLNQTPTAFYPLIEEILDEKPDLFLRYVIFGGEKLLPYKLKAWEEIYPQTKLINMYGITETTIHVTYKEIKKEDISIGISNVGQPIPTTTTYILDNYCNLQAKGVIGEIYVGGKGLARGYIGNEKLTRERFIDNPFEKGERLYKSGDLGRILESGEIEYLYRSDNQEQIRGYRIEFGEIETALLKHDKIKETIVIARGQEGEKNLCAYIVSEEEIEISELRIYLSQSLPDYMLPSYFVRLENMPLTSNGKIDRKALPEPEIKVGEEYVAPSNDIEEKLVIIWSEVLKLNKDQISVNRSFFELGGHSLNAMIIISRIEKEFNIKIQLKTVFNKPTIIELRKNIMITNLSKSSLSENTNKITI